MKSIFILVILVVSRTSYSQEISKDLYLKRIIRQENQTYQFKVMENTSDNEVTYHHPKFYYWFKSQHVVRTQGASSGQLLHGIFESFYDNNQLSSKGLFNKGLKHGVWTYWNLNGIIIRKETWDYGIQRGDETVYDAQGKWLQTIDYGFRTNERTNKDSIIVTDKEGVRKKVMLLDSLGNPFQTIKFKNGYPVKGKEGKNKDEKTKEARVKSQESLGESDETKDGKNKDEKTKKSRVKSQKSLGGSDETKEGKTKDGKTKDRKIKEKRPKTSDVRQETEGNFWKRLFSKKKMDVRSQQAPKKFSWKFWKKDNSTKK
jgi:hypothetical protein